MKDQSGPAFPGTEYTFYDGNPQVSEYHVGMTKRELIAMGQMKAWRRLLGHEWPAETIAIYAIQDADALLAELGRE